MGEIFILDSTNCGVGDLLWVDDEGLSGVLENGFLELEQVRRVKKIKRVIANRKNHFFLFCIWDALLLLPSILIKYLVLQINKLILVQSSNLVMALGNGY